MPGQLSNARLPVLAWRAPKIALALWLTSMLLLLAACSFSLPDSARHLLGGSLQTRVRLAGIAFALMTGSWLFLALFGLTPLGGAIKTGVKLTTHGCIVLLSLIVGTPADLLLQVAALGILACLMPTAIATIEVVRASPERAARWFLAGVVSLVPVIALALASSAQANAFDGQYIRPDHAAIVAPLLVTTCVAIFAWFTAVSSVATAVRTKLEAARDKVADSARKYRHVYYSVPIALLSVDRQGNVLRWNEMAHRAFGKVLLGGRLNPVSLVLGQSAAEALLQAVGDHGRHRVELELDLSGESRTYAVDAIATGSDIELSFGDVSERSRLAATMEHIAHHDFLTNCLNRRGIEREIDGILERIDAGETASLVYVDLDRFKAINDVFGHAAGDAVVLEVSKRLGEELPPAARVGRIGGDEFITMLPGLDLEAARTQANRFLTALTRETVDFEGLKLSVEASIGVIEAAPGMKTRDLLAYADEACAQSKRSGRGRITALDPGNEALVNYRAEKVYGSQLRFRLPTERMRVYAQPIVPLQDSDAPMSYEILLRTEDEQGRIESPARLIAAAERQGAMAAIDRFMLARTVSHLVEHPDYTAKLGFVSVNLSGMSLNDERFVSDAIALLREHRAVASKLCLEITESVALYDISSTRRFVDEMHAIGATIALDDFGAGYTSFAYLKDLPASLLKIDGQFIIGLGSGSKSIGIVRAIKQVGCELGMQCLAEWVEDEATLHTLRELGIDYAQGYVFSRARPIEHWLNHSVDLTPLLATQP